MRRALFRRKLSRDSERRRRRSVSSRQRAVRTVASPRQDQHRIRRQARPAQRRQSSDRIDTAGRRAYTRSRAVPDRRRFVPAATNSKLRRARRHARTRDVRRVRAGAGPAALVRHRRYFRFAGDRQRELRHRTARSDGGRTDRWCVPTFPGIDRLSFPTTTACCTRPTTSSRLADALCGLVENDDRRTTLSINGRKRALEFAWPRVTDEIEAVYQSLISRPRSSTADRRPAARSAA